MKKSVPFNQWQYRFDCRLYSSMDELHSAGAKRWYADLKQGNVQNTNINLINTIYNPR